MQSLSSLTEFAPWSGGHWAAVFMKTVFVPELRENSPRNSNLSVIAAEARVDTIKIKKTDASVKRKPLLNMVFYLC